MLILLTNVHSSLQLREELEAMIVKDLLGPGGEDEEILNSPDSLYIVDVLEPRFILQRRYPLKRNRS